MDRLLIKDQCHLKRLIHHLFLDFTFELLRQKSLTRLIFVHNSPRSTLFEEILSKLFHWIVKLIKTRLDSPQFSLKCKTSPVTHWIIDQQIEEQTRQNNYFMKFKSFPHKNEVAWTSRSTIEFPSNDQRISFFFRPSS